MLQLVALGELRDIEEGRTLIAAAEPLKIYEPIHTAEWDEAYKRFLQIVVK